MKYYKLDQWNNFKTENGYGHVEPGLGLRGGFHYDKESRWVCFTLEQRFEVPFVEDWGEQK